MIDIDDGSWDVIDSSFSLTINSGSDSKFILPLKYGSGKAHHDLTIDWGDGNIQTVTGTADITTQYQGLTHNYNSATTQYTIKLTGTTYLETVENGSYYGLGFYSIATGYNVAANKVKVIAASGSPDNLLSASMTNKNYCYQCMFYGCTSLTMAPALPATTLASGCYNYMFYGCTSLATGPSILPVTTLATECYRSMFQSCTKLTTAPELPATVLTDRCYAYMFQNCTSLNNKTITIAATPSDISWAADMFNLKSSNPKATLYLDADQTIFNAYNIASVKGSYTDLVKYIP
jgi:hypothetical protein